MSRFYITTPIYYVTDKPHIGHLYTTLAADIMARYQRLRGKDVWFLTGTDEHGQKVEKSAETAGITPQAIADQNSVHFREITPLLNLSNDDWYVFNVAYPVESLTAVVASTNSAARALK